MNDLACVPPRGTCLQISVAIVSANERASGSLQIRDEALQLGKYLVSAFEHQNTGRG